MDCSLLLGRLSGLISPRRTTFSGFTLSMNEANRSLFMRPSGSTSTFTLAGAVGDRGSKTMLAFEGAGFLQLWW